MPVFTEGTHRGAYLHSEANRTQSRDAIILKSGAGVVLPGTVLGKVAVGAATAAAKSGGNTGNGVAPTVTLLANAEVGIYTLRYTSATAFRVVDPKGRVIGDGANGTAFADQLGLTMTTGGTPFVAGDGFDITVAEGSSKYVPLNPAALDGSQRAIAIAFDTTDATSADQAAVITARDSEVNSFELIWPTGISGPNLAAGIASLAAVGILCR